MFDLWHTLAFHDREGARKSGEEVTSYLQSFNPEVSEKDYSALREKYHKPITTGQISLGESNIRILMELGIPEEIEWELTGRIESSMRRNIRKYDGVDDLLGNVHGLGLKLGLVTNCGAGTMDLLQEMGLDVFESYGFSDEVGVRKPDPKIYLKVTGELGVDPADCVFVSDEIDEDLVGAKELGMKTVHVKVAERAWSVFEVDPDERVIEPDACVNNIVDVYSIIENLIEQ